MFLDSLSSAAMEKSLSALWQRGQLINANIANKDTPGYKAKRISFESSLERELEKVKSAKNMTRREAVEKVKNSEEKIYSLDNYSLRADGNNVDVNSEQIEQVRVAYQYQALTQKITGHYNTLKYAISGGR